MNEGKQSVDRMTRRRALARALGVAAGVAVVAPSSWTRPVVTSVLLPAHAQTSPGVLILSAGSLSNATSETRTPSGGAAVDALSTLTVSGCVSIPGAAVTCSAIADLGGTPVNVGSGSAVANADGSFSVVINVPTSAVAPTAAVTQLDVTCDATSGDLSTSEPLAVTPANLSGALAGTASPAARAI